MDTLGSFECKCQDGCRFSQLSQSCLDVDECEENTYFCGKNEMCVNTYGSYKCGCRDGYIFDRFALCVKDEKSPKELCFENCKSPNGLCTRVASDWICQCQIEIYGGEDCGECLCQNGGTCSGYGMCLCPKSHEGSLCELEKRQNIVTVMDFVKIEKEDNVGFQWLPPNKDAGTKACSPEISKQSAGI